MSGATGIFKPYVQDIPKIINIDKISPGLYHHGAPQMLGSGPRYASGHNALSIAPNQWRMLVVETSSPYISKFDICKVCLSFQIPGLPYWLSEDFPGLRYLYFEATQHTDDRLQLIEPSLVTAEVSKCLENTLDTLPRWIAECYLPLLRCAYPLM